MDEYIKVTINDQEITAKKGQTILEIAQHNGIYIPTLCNDERLKTYAACGLCIVEVEGNNKLLRACATEAADGMVIHTESDRIVKQRKINMELVMSDHEGDCRGPCHLNCPAGEDPQRYLKAIQMKDYKWATEIIREHIPLPSSIGRICPHPCEDNCRRGLVDQPLSICALKAYASDRDYESDDPFKLKVEGNSDKSVCVIGAGPAGLACAYYLRQKGHNIRILEAQPKAGGFLRYGIPEYRLPKAILQKEVDVLTDAGVQIDYGVKVGKDVTLEELKAQYDAVVIACGAWADMPLRCPGTDLEGVYGGTAFLAANASGNAPEIGKNVAIVGGGNTAMDCCRSAVRLGAENVYVIYRRTRDEMPAEDDEIEEAIEEGVDFKFLTNPDEILGKDGKVTGVRLQVMELGEPDASGRRKPVPVEGKFEELELDSVIAALGHGLVRGEWDMLDKSQKGNIDCGENSFRTSMEGVFACGECTNKGATIAVRAIGQAGKCAAMVDSYLDKKADFYKEPFYSERKIDETDLADEPKKPRVEKHLRPAAERRCDFSEINLGLSEEEAVEEAKRCLECGCHAYFDCKLIEAARRYKIDIERMQGEKHDSFVEHDLKYIERNQGKCILCGICVRTCDEIVGKGVLGLVRRGFKTVIKPEFRDKDTVEFCKNCMKCVDACPTGALRRRLPAEIAKDED